jgi:hypothetical protein
MRWLLLATLFVLPCLSAQSFDLPDRARHRPALFEIERGGASDTMHDLGDVSFGGSAGIAFSPLGFLGTAEADFWFAPFFSAGPMVQVVAGEDFIFAVGGGPKFTFDFGDDLTELVKPYIQLGPGLVVVSADHHHDHGRHHGHHHHTELGFLLMAGFGIDFYVWENVSLGTGVLFNFMPTRPVDDSFYFGWKVIEAKVHF